MLCLVLTWIFVYKNANRLGEVLLTGVKEKNKKHLPDQKLHTRSLMTRLFAPGKKAHLGQQLQQNSPLIKFPVICSHPSRPSCPPGRLTSQSSPRTGGPLSAIQAETSNAYSLVSARVNHPVSSARQVWVLCFLFNKNCQNLETLEYWVTPWYLPARVLKLVNTDVQQHGQCYSKSSGVGPPCSLLWSCGSLSR